MMGLDVYNLVLIAFATIVATAPLQNNTVGVSEPKGFYCYGDYCTTDEPNEFCSDFYRMCRPCTDIIDDCLSSDLPRNCLRTCIRYYVEQQVKDLQGKTCPVLSEITHGAHNGSVTDTHIPGEVIDYYCDMGYTLQCDGRRECRPRGYWSHDNPKCERVKCQQPHPLRNGKWLQDSNWYVWGHTLRAQCEEGFSMDGPSDWHCSNEGKWKNSGSPSLPVCFRQGKPTEPCSCIYWQIGFGVVLFISIGFLYLLLRQRSLLKQLKDDCMVTKQENNNADIAACGIDDERRTFLDEKVFSLRDQNNSSEKVLLSEEIHIPAPNTYNSQSKDQPVSLSNIDTSMIAQGPITVNVINNHTIQNTAINETLDRTDQQTSNTTADDNTSNVTNTTKAETILDDNAPVEESGESCIPSQPESAYSTHQNQSSGDILPSQLESPGDTVSSQSELSGGALQRQAGSYDGTQQGQLETSGDGLTNQSEISLGHLPSNHGIDATLPNQNESYSH